MCLRSLSCTGKSFCCWWVECPGCVTAPGTRSLSASLLFLENVFGKRHQLLLEGLWPCRGLLGGCGCFLLLSGTSLKTAAGLWSAVPSLGEQTSGTQVEDRGRSGRLRTAVFITHTVYRHCAQMINSRRTISSFLAASESLRGCTPSRALGQAPSVLRSPGRS